MEATDYGIETAMPGMNREEGIGDKIWRDGLLRRLGEVERFHAKIVDELTKDTPCDGAVNRELLELELGALTRDHASIENKLNLLSTMTFQAASRDGWKDKPNEIAGRSSIPGAPSHAAKPRRQQETYRSEPLAPSHQNIVGACSSDMVESRAFTEALIDSRGAVHNSIRQPFRFSAQASMGSRGATGGRDLDGHVHSASEGANRFEQVTAHAAEEDFSRCSSNAADNKRRCLEYLPPTRHGNCFAGHGNGGDCGGGDGGDGCGSGTPSMFQAGECDENFSASRQTTSEATGGVPAQTNPSEMGQHWWVSAPFAGNVLTVGGAPICSRTRTREPAAVSSHAGLAEREPVDSSLRCPWGQSTFGGEVGRTSSWQEQTRNSESSSRGSLQAQAASPSSSTFPASATYDGHLHASPPVSYPSPTSSHPREHGRRWDKHGIIEEAKRNMNHEEPFSKGRSFRIREEPTRSCWPDVPGDWSRTNRSADANLREFHVDNRNAFPAAMAIDAGQERIGEARQPKHSRQGHELDGRHSRGGMTNISSSRFGSFSGQGVFGQGETGPPSRPPPMY